MTRLRARVRRDERGATLILAIAFMLVIGGLAAAVLLSVSSGINDRNTLDSARNQQYAADGGVEWAIAQVRALSGGGPGIDNCASNSPAHYDHTLAGVNIRIDCANDSTLTETGLLQRNVVFTACVEMGSPCVNLPPGTKNTIPTNSPTIIRAQVNFQAGSGPGLNVTRTWVQSWSVNK